MLAVAGVVVVLLGFAWTVFFSPVFALDTNEVTIAGEGTVIDPAQVTAVVDGLAGTPLPRIDTVGLRDRVLDVAGVRDVTITRDWPSGLAIELVSREPVAAVPEGSGVVLLDDEGVRVGVADSAPEGMPLIAIPLDDHSRRTLESTLVLLNILPVELRAEVAEVSADSPDAVRMTLRDGAEVLWGDSSEAELKLRVFQALRGAEQTAGSQVFDVSAPTAPIVR